MFIVIVILVCVRDRLVYVDFSDVVFLEEMFKFVFCRSLVVSVIVRRFLVVRFGRSGYGVFKGRGSLRY